MQDTTLTITIVVSEEDYEHLADNLVATLDSDLYDIEYTWTEAGHRASPQDGDRLSRPLDTEPRHDMI